MPDSCAPHPGTVTGGGLKREGPQCIESRALRLGPEGSRLPGRAWVSACSHVGQHRTTEQCPRSWKGAGGHGVVLGQGPALPAAGLGPAPTWEGGQVAGEGAGLALGPVPLLQLALQGVKLAVAAVDEVLGSPLRLHLDDEDLGQRPGG